jgi:hypothetical protein
MRMLKGVVLVFAALSVPAVARAQMGRPMHEFGVDLAAMYQKVGSGCSTDCGYFQVGVPVDLRIGFLTQGPLSVEPRLTFSYLSGGGGHLLAFDPHLNVLYRLGAGTGPHSMMGPYVTVGAGVAIVNASVSGGTSSTSTQLSVNAGIGMRSAFESAAFRPEAFFAYNFENKGKNIPSSIAIGARIGLSFFH